MRYIWSCKKTNKEIEVVRKVAEYERPPTKEECIDEGWTEDEYSQAVFTKLLVPLVNTGVKGKGNWIILLGVGSFLQQYLDIAL